MASASAVKAASKHWQAADKQHVHQRCGVHQQGQPQQQKGQQQGAYGISVRDKGSKQALASSRHATSLHQGCGCSWVAVDEHIAARCNVTARCCLKTSGNGVTHCQLLSPAQRLWVQCKSSCSATEDVPAGRFENQAVGAMSLIPQHLTLVQQCSGCAWWNGATSLLVRMWRTVIKQEATAGKPSLMLLKLVTRFHADLGVYY
jgi:hypothetical protein